MGERVSFGLLVVGFVVYFLPMAIAWIRDCKAGAGIFVVNLFLGWTFIGWVVALAWAACGEKDVRKATAAVTPTA